jgi:hypothetical protein
MTDKCGIDRRRLEKIGDPAIFFRNIRINQYRDISKTELLTKGWITYKSTTIAA